MCNEIHAEEMHQMTQQAGYDHGQFWVGGYNTPEVTKMFVKHFNFNEFA